MIELRPRRLAFAAGIYLLLACAPGTPGAATDGPTPAQTPDDPWAQARARMVDSQLRARDIRDERVLRAMARVPRHLFVPEARRRAAYEDGALPIGLGQTISQPYIVAYMTEALRLRPTDRVLEIGTGSGYQAAVLAELVDEVFTMEIVEALAERARGTLESLGYRNVRVRCGNGYLGWPERAPFDKIIVTAAPEQVPPALIAQLAPGGILVAPVGAPTQVLTIVEKTPTGLTERRTLPVLFVPMTGKPGGRR